MTNEDLHKNKASSDFLTIACFIGVVTSLIVNSFVTNQIIQEAQEGVKEDLNTARWVYTSKIRDIGQTIHWTSIRHVLKKGIKEKSFSSIRGELSGLMVEEGLNFLRLVNGKRTVIFRFHNPQVSGDSLIQDPFVKKALEKKGISATQILSREELLKEGEALAQKATLRLIPTSKAKPIEKGEVTSGMVLKSAQPVIDFNSEVLGALTGGILLNCNYEIVDRIKNIVFKDAKYRGKEIGTATVFLGGVRISTNVMNKEGKRAIGTRAMKEAQEQVLEKGRSWIQRAFVVDNWHITAYEPIRDIQDKL